jgi:hypothetical protein
MRFSIYLVSILLVTSSAGCLAATNKLSPPDQQILDFMNKLAANPQLLDPRFLSYKFGPPEVKWGGDYEWCEARNHNRLYLLEQRPSLNNGEIHSKLTIYTPTSSHITFADLESTLSTPPVEHVDRKPGQTGTFTMSAVSNPPLKEFDQRVYKTETFAMSAYTNVSGAQPPNTFKLTEIVVDYDGPKLSPSDDEIQAAVEDRRAVAFEHHKNGRHDQALPLLRSHLKEQPADVEARIKLAESYRGRFCLNQAIEQYRIALAECGDDSALRQQCIDGLKSLRVIPLEPGEKLPPNPVPTPPTQDNSLKSKFLGLFKEAPAPAPNTLEQVSPTAPSNGPGTSAPTALSGVPGPGQFNAGF